MKIFELISYVFFGAVIIVVLFLAMSVFPIFGYYRVMVVQSGSMEPAVKTGSIVAVKSAENYNANDIVSFADAKTPKKTITHRIIEIKEKDGEKKYATKGDANSERDFNEVAQENIIGKVFLTVPYLGYVIHTAKQPYGFATLVVVPALIIIFDEFGKIKSEIVRMKKLKNDTKKKIYEG